MTEPRHTQFHIDRDVAASRAHVFRFFSELELKVRWNDCHTDWQLLEEAFDFRVGGGEVRRWRTPDGEELTFHSHYLDIVPGERIIYAYQMTFGGERLSASMVTLTFTGEGRVTRIRFLEQAAMLTGGDQAIDQRIHGTGEGLDRLVEMAGE